MGWDHVEEGISECSVHVAAIVGDLEVPRMFHINGGTLVFVGTCAEVWDDVGHGWPRVERGGVCFVGRDSWYR